MESPVEGSVTYKMEGYDEGSFERTKSGRAVNKEHSE